MLYRWSYSKYFQYYCNNVQILAIKKEQVYKHRPTSLLSIIQEKKSVSSPIPDGIWNKKAKEIGKYYDGSIVELLYVLKTLM